LNRASEAVAIGYKVFMARSFRVVHRRVLQCGLE
jgi:hypothetical protein